MLDEIASSMEYDENITIDFDIPLDKQKLNEKTWDMLEKVLKSAKRNGYKESKNEEKETDDIEKIKLKNIALMKQVQDITEKSRELVTDYKKAFEMAQAENESLKKDFEELSNRFNQIPKWIRRFFLKDAKIKMSGQGK